MEDNTTVIGNKMVIKAIRDVMAKNDTSQTFIEDEISDALMTYAPPILLILGTLSNLVAFSVFQSPNLKNIVNTLYYRSLVWADLYILYIAMGTATIEGVSDIKIVTSHLWSCKVISYALHVGLHFAHWGLTLCIMERTFGVFHPTRAMHLWTKGKAFRTFYVLIAISMLINFPALFAYGLQPDLPGLGIEDTVCRIGLEKDQWKVAKEMWICLQFILYTCVPFVATLLCNIALNYQLRKPRPGSEDIPLPKALITSMSIILILLFLTTFTLTTPLSIYDLALYFQPSAPESPSEGANLRLVYTVCYLLSYTTRVIKFLVFRAICPRFRGEFLRMYCCEVPEPRRSQSVSASTVSSAANISNSTKN